MAGQQNVFFNNGIQMPMFTGASQSTGQFGNTDVDLGDLFADYFVNEMEANDQRDSYNQLLALQAASAPVANPLLAPVPAATAPQGLVPTLTNPNESLASMAASQQIQNVANNTNVNVALPIRRGIKTAWHSGTLPNLQSTYQVAGDILQQQQHQQQHQAQQHQAQQAFAHIAKRMKASDQNNSFLNTATPLSNSTSDAHANVATTSGSAISGRLGFTMVGGQLAVPNRSKENQNQTSENSETSQKASEVGGGISLPVGVGIRIGGQTGAVHQSQQADAANASSSSNVLQSGHWGANSGIWSSSGLMGVENGGGGLSEQVIAERRQRNREHAKRSRVRKKFLLESLQEQVRSLQKENSGLRMLVYEAIPQNAQKIISECCKASPLFSDDSKDGSENKHVELVKSDFSLIESLSSGQQNFVLSDPRLPDNPIVFASEGFYKLTGYTREQVLGRNCRFLQGPQTDQKALDVIRTAIANGTDATACLLNYKADGTPFWNQFFVAALRDADNNIVNYVGVQCAIEPEAGSSALEDKVNSVMPLQEKDEGDEDKGSS